MTTEAQVSDSNPFVGLSETEAGDRIARLLSTPETGTEESEADTPSAPSPETAEADTASVEVEESGDEGGEVDEAEAQSDGDDSSPRYTVKVDGKEVEVTLEELKAGFSFNTRNTQKAQELAAQRKAFEAEAAETRQLRDRYAAVLPDLEKIVQGSVDEYDSVDWEALRKEDPQAFALHRAEYQLRQERLKKVQEERASEEARMSQEAAARASEEIERETSLLLEKVPEWRDEKTRNSELVSIAKFAEEVGFSRDDLSNLVDHRAYLILRMAYQWSKASQNAESAKRKVSEVKAAARPGSGSKKTSSDGLDRQRQRLRQTGRVEDAASVLEMMLSKQDASKAR